MGVAANLADTRGSSLSARSGPAGVWIELTSKCPIRCVFCSRENLRGEGEHMDFAVFEALLRSLDSPEVVRLNYSGESANYPRLIDAIRLTKAATQAQIEMVTALVTMPMEAVQLLPGSGIDRISISMHTRDERRFPAIYGAAALQPFDRRLESLLEAARRESHPPVIDFAAVAMQSNMDEMPALASTAAAAGASSLSIHPVIARPGVPELFQIESDSRGKLTPDFQQELNRRIDDARAANPGLKISVARPPAAVRGRGPFTCEQNPFETTHILSNGDVVPCEVLDRVPLGNAGCTGLEGIWEGAAYRDFRTRYEADRVPECSDCIFRAPVADVGPVRTLWGWYGQDKSETLWSRTTASFECEAAGSNCLRVTGLLPPGSGSNSIEFHRNGQPVGTVRNEGDTLLEFQIDLPLSGSVEVNRFVAHTEQGYSSWRRGTGNDSRELGFALFNAAFSEGVSPKPEIRPGPTLALKKTVADTLLRSLELLPRGIEPNAPRFMHAPDASLAVIIPERGSPTMLARCLAALNAAIAEVRQKVHVVVVVNGSHKRDYEELRRVHPGFAFVFVKRPLGFTKAIRRGLDGIDTGWVYLLNSDVLLQRDALAKLLPHRSAEVFSLASRIEMTTDKGESETNRTSLKFKDGLVELVELNGKVTGPVPHLYGGGGASVFQTSWLRAFAADTGCYEPFYWEDAEWGVRARAAGLENLFVPESLARHEGKATVSRFYPPQEVTRIFERNRVQFQLRCMPDGINDAIRERLAHAPWQTLRELLSPFRLFSTARARASLSGRP